MRDGATCRAGCERLGSVSVWNPCVIEWTGRGGWTGWQIARGTLGAESPALAVAQTMALARTVALALAPAPALALAPVGDLLA